MQRKITPRFTVQVTHSNCLTSIILPDLHIYLRLLKLITSINQSTWTFCCLENKSSKSSTWRWPVYIFHFFYHSISHYFLSCGSLPYCSMLSSPSHTFLFIQAELIIPDPAFTQHFCACCFYDLLSYYVFHLH